MANIKIEKSLMSLAIQGDKGSLVKIFDTFLADDENIIVTEYLGSYGVLFKTHSFICVTDKKVAALEYGPMGKIIYSDAFIEEINSGIVYQPSLFKLYAIGALLCLSLFGIILLNAWVRLFYTVNKSGLVWSVKEGISIYAFTNRSKIDVANNIWRKASYLRTHRKLDFTK